MRRLIAILVLVAVTLLTATPADAFWRHHWGRGWGGWGHRGWYGYRGVGWGYRGVGWRGVGYRGYAVPYYGGGFYPGYYQSSYAPWYGCYNDGGYGGTMVNVGYPGYGFYGANYGPSSNLIASSVARSSPIVAAAPIQRRPAPAMIARAAPTAQAIQQFLGLREIRPISFGNGPTLASAEPAQVPLRNLGDILARVSNVDSRRKAERLLAEGDELFRVQNYHSALQRYKLAASTSPDFPEALWRKGHALVATHNYDLATTAFKRAIAVTEDLGRDGFRLSDIYAGATMTKTQHLESLAEWTISHRDSSDPYFLLGLFLTYDDQPARAEKFFQKASDLAGISGGHIAVFLDEAESAPRARPAVVARPAASMPIIPVSIGIGTEI